MLPTFTPSDDDSFFPSTFFSSATWPVTSDPSSDRNSGIVPNVSRCDRKERSGDGKGAIAKTGTRNKLCDDSVGVWMFLLRVMKARSAAPPPQTSSTTAESRTSTPRIDVGELMVRRASRRESRPPTDGRCCGMTTRILTSRFSTPSQNKTYGKKF